MFNSPVGGVPLGRSLSNFSWMSTDGQDTKCRRKIAENYNGLSRVQERYRRQTGNSQTDGREHIANVNTANINVSSRSLKIIQITRVFPDIRSQKQCIAALFMNHSVHITRWMKTGDLVRMANSYMTYDVDWWFESSRNTMMLQLPALLETVMRLILARCQTASSSSIIR